MIGTAAQSNVMCSVEGPCIDEFTHLTRARKQVKQNGWYKKSTTRATDGSDFPKIEGSEKIRILKTKQERKSIQKMPDGEFRIKDLPL